MEKEKIFVFYLYHQTREWNKKEVIKTENETRGKLLYYTGLLKQRFKK